MSHEKKFEHDDPMELEAVWIPDGDLEAQARSFIMEFLAMGFSTTRLLELFHDPFYMGPNAILNKLGEQRVREIIADCGGALFNVSIIEY